MPVAVNLLQVMLLVLAANLLQVMLMGRDAADAEFTVAEHLGSRSPGRT